MQDILLDRKYKHSRCGAGTHRHFYVNPEGNLSMCADKIFDENYYIGNIRDGLKPYLGKTFLDTKRCQNCDSANLCAGGCLVDVREWFDEGYHHVKCGGNRYLINTLKSKKNAVISLIDSGIVDIPGLIGDNELFYGYSEIIP